MRFLLGGYGADGGGEATGIGELLAGAPDDHLAGGPLGFGGDAVAADSPSWIAAHPTLDVVYAALERRGAIQAYRRTGDSTFVPLGAPVPVGDGVCHVAPTPDHRGLIASCWGDGRVVRMTLDAGGRPHSPVVAPAAADPYSGSGILLGATGDSAPDLAAAARALRDAAGAEFAHLVPFGAEDAPEAVTETRSDGPDAVRPSRAHQARALPDGSFATTDMGLDLVRFWRRGDDLAVGQQLVFPYGSGPRHSVWHPSGHLYVVTELSREVFAVRWEDSATGGSWRIVGGCSLGPTLEGDTAAEIALSHDGEFVYVGVRGSDTIATLRVRGAGEILEPVALVGAEVEHPRHHLVVRDTLLVAGQRSDDVVSLTLDTRGGVPGRVRHRTAAPSPTCILPV